MSAGALGHRGPAAPVEQVIQGVMRDTITTKRLAGLRTATPIVIQMIIRDAFTNRDRQNQIQVDAVAGA